MEAMKRVSHCRDEGVLPQVLSKMYILLNTPVELPDLTHIKKWETDLQCQFTDTQKQTIIRFSLKSSICTKTQELNYKILTRWYYTPVRLHKIFPSSSDRCWRCHSAKRTLLHIFWSCPLLQHFWTTVRMISQKFTDYPMNDNPAFILLHVSSIPPKKYKKSIIRHLLNAAKSCIPLLWKKTLPPTVGMWLRRVVEIRRLEDLVLTAQNKQEQHLNTWMHWNIFIYSDEGQNMLTT